MKFLVLAALCASSHAFLAAPARRAVAAVRAAAVDDAAADEPDEPSLPKAMPGTQTSELPGDRAQPRRVFDLGVHRAAIFSCGR